MGVAWRAPAFSLSPRPGELRLGSCVLESSRDAREPHRTTGLHLTPPRRNALALTSAFRVSGSPAPKAVGFWLLGLGKSGMRVILQLCRRFRVRFQASLPPFPTAQSQQPRAATPPFPTANSPKPTASLTGTRPAPFPGVRLIPWWLSGREEKCGACGHHFAHRGGARCATCDREVCLTCVEHADGELRCVPCGDGEAKPKKRRVPWRPVRSGKG